MPWRHQVKLVGIEIFKSRDQEPRAPQACEPVTVSLCLEAKSLEPFALELRVDYSIPAESLKLSITKNRNEPKD